MPLRAAVGRSFLSGLILWAVLWAACESRAVAQVEAGGSGASSDLRDPQGSILVGVSGGASFGSEVQYGSIGVQGGYAVVTGVVPGLRTTFLFGDLSGGEVVGTVWLTPPLSFAVVPFAVLEAGYAWQSFRGADADGAVYGVGGGLHLGRPRDVFNLRAGVIYRYYDFGVQRDVVAPIVVGSFRF